jgi:hypothetical protein
MAAKAAVVAAKKNKWIQKATKNARGQFSKKAAKAGMSTHAYAQKVLKSPRADSKTKKQANLALNLEKMRGKRKRKKSTRSSAAGTASSLRIAL